MQGCYDSIVMDYDNYDGIGSDTVCVQLRQPIKINVIHLSFTVYLEYRILSMVHH